MTQWLGFLNPDPYLSVGLAGLQKERKKMKTPQWQQWMNPPNFFYAQVS